MIPQDENLASRTKCFWVFVLFAVGTVLLKAGQLGQDPIAGLVAADTDDIMRFLSVRDWLAGQGWFDMHQSGVVSEGGLNLHWSRLVDVGIAAIIWPISFIVTMEAAEGVGIVLWPLLLQSALIFITAREGLRNFGPQAAAGAVLCLLMWPTILHYFAPARLDHHNVQILLLTVVIFSLLRQNPTVRTGAIAGVASAGALAVGLETLPALALAGLIVSLRAIFVPNVFARSLLGYSVALGIGGLALSVVQTAPSRLLQPQCDQLGFPILYLLGAVTITAVLLSLALPRTPSLVRRLLLAGILYTVAVALSIPTVLSCAGGPYSSLPPAVEVAIYAQIKEAMSVFDAALRMPKYFHVNIMPLLIGLTIGTVLWYCDHDPQRKRKTGVLLVFGWFAAIATTYQVRMIVIGAAVLPLLTGEIMGRIFEWRRSYINAVRATSVFLVVGLLTIFYPYAYAAANSSLSQSDDISPKKGSNGADCRTHTVLETLRDLPKGWTLSNLNLGPSILLSADLPILAAPYHRSAAAMSNGLLTFGMDEDAFLKAVLEMEADYVVLCRNDKHSGFTAELAKGVQTDGLQLVLDVHPALAVYKVSK